ncbi:hypothetical protein C8R44DRAFT_753652 [Mycena epipterygia]|nr:hypothetical protein C8R44DRAFT_753652 [Mycena epipterygia]
MYSAKVEGRKSPMTVVIYQGESAEEQWRKDISTYSRLRHPNFVQIYGAASSSCMHATIFHDDLYRHSPILTVYIWGCCCTEYTVRQGNFMGQLTTHSKIRKRTIIFAAFLSRTCGRLCTELVTGSPEPISFWLKSKLQFPLIPGGLVTLNRPDQEAVVISSLTLHQYHNACYWHLGQFRGLSISLREVVKPGAVFSVSSRSSGSRPVEIASSISSLHTFGETWYMTGGNVKEDLIPDGWTRYASCDVFDCEFHKRVALDNPEAWLGQANHIFSQLQITSNCEDYDFQTGPCSLRWPDSPAYWSLDPSGIDRLSTEEADNLGFPIIELNTGIEGWSCDTNVYAGLRQFHLAKGFDPESQDVVRHLGDPFYHLSEELVASSTHSEWINITFDEGASVEAAEDSSKFGSCSEDDDDASSEHAIEDAPSIFSPDTAKMSTLLRGHITMNCVQFGLILTLTLFCLYDYLRSW